MPNNRQWAWIFWGLVALVVVLIYPQTRKGLGDIARTAWPKIVISLALLIAWTCGLAVFGSRIGLWNARLVADSGFWFATTALVLFLNFTNASTEPHFFRTRLAATLTLTVAVEVFLELAVLDLVAEIVLLPFLAFLGGVSAVAGSRQEWRPVKPLFDVLLALIGLTFLLYVGVVLVHGWSSTDWPHNARQFGLPVWMTIGILPYIYGLAVVAGYGSAFSRMDWRSERSWRTRTRSKLVLLSTFRMRAHDLNGFAGRWQQQLASANTFREGRQVVREFSQAQAEATNRAAEDAARLVRYAGSQEVDTDNRRLDRREFKETTNALRWLATCQMGWHRNDDRYRSDLLEFVDFRHCGLNEPSGIVMNVSADGRSWYAWRRSATGWVFAIGSAGPPPDQWEYDGPEPPTGFPGKDPAWGSRPFGQEVSPNW